MQHKHLRYVLFVMGFYLLVQPTMAVGGIDLRLLAHRQSAMGNTGTGLSLSASSMFDNPGSLSFVYRNHIQFGASVILPKTSFLAETPSLYEAEMDEALINTPIFFYSSWHKKNSRFSFGISANNPFGTASRWEDDWKGRFIAQEFSLRVYFLQPTISYQVNERLGVGMGVIMGFGHILFRKGLPLNGINTEQSSTELSGIGTGLGISMGVYYRSAGTLSLGIGYRSGLRLQVDRGKALFEVPNSLQESYPNSRFSTEVPIPHVINLGLGYHPRAGITFAFDLSYTLWGKLNNIEINFKENTSELDDLEFIQQYENTFAVRTGIEYSLQENIFLRGGAYYEVSPVQDGYLSPEFPDADRIGFTTGVGIKFAKSISLDMSYIYEFTGERTGILESAGFGGKYISNSSTFGLGINYAF